MITAEDLAYASQFRRLYDMGFNTQEKLEKVIDIMAECRGDLPKAAEKMLNMLKD